VGDRRNEVPHQGSDLPTLHPNGSFARAHSARRTPIDDHLVTMHDLPKPFECICFGATVGRHLGHAWSRISAQVIAIPSAPNGQARALRNKWSRNEENLGFIVFRYACGRACVRRPPPETPQIPRRRSGDSDTAVIAGHVAFSLGDKRVQDRVLAQWNGLSPKRRSGGEVCPVIAVFAGLFSFL
jgi:hypothetical protein